jgi:hypothetical protein
MTLAQRKKYNEYMRKKYLRKQLERGRVPQPIKPATWLLSLYREFNVENAVSIPQSWMDAKTLHAIKLERKRVRARIRNSLPAEATRKQIDSAVAEIARRNVLRKFSSV